MAVTSGSFNTTSYSNRNLVFSWSLQSQSIESNTSVISWTLKGGGSASGYYLTQNITLTINGVTVYSHGQSPQIKLWNGTTVASGTASITHGTTGTKTFSASCTAGIYEWSPNVSGSGSWELPTIPRYASVSQSLQSKTETTAVIKWTSDSTCDKLWYSTNNGSTWTSVTISNSSSGTYTISGLTANTTYQVKTRLRRKDSQLTSDSTALSVTTYAYPFANSMPDFVIGNSLTVGLYNPLGRTVTIDMIMADNSEKSAGGTWSGTTVQPFNSSAWQTALYASIPNAQSGRYKIRVTYGGYSVTSNGGTYSVNPSDCLPEIGGVTYKDIDSSTTGITQDDQKIVRNTSIVRYTATGLAGAKSATIASASVSVNGQTYAMTVSGSTATGGDAVINSGMNVDATVTVTDSRGLTASKKVTVTMLDWYLPSAIITLNRRDNYYTATDCKVDADIAYVDGLNTVTITFKAKISGTSGWTVTGTMQDNVTSTFNLDNTYAWDILISLVDRFGGTTSYNLHISRGMPIIYFDRIKSSVGVNCFPKDNQSLELNGYTLCKNIRTRRLTSNLSNLTASAYVKIPLDGDVVIGDKLTLETTDIGGIVIGANVTKVLVSGAVQFETVASDGLRYMRIIKNNTNTGNNLSWQSAKAVSGNRLSLVSPSKLVEVTAGDVIYLCYDTPDANDVIGGSNAGQTFLTVEVVG